MNKRTKFLLKLGGSIILGSAVFRLLNSNGKTRKLKNDTVALIEPGEVNLQIIRNRFCIFGDNQKLAVKVPFGSKTASVDGQSNLLMNDYDEKIMKISGEYNIIDRIRYGCQNFEKEYTLLAIEENPEKIAAWIANGEKI